MIIRSPCQTSDPIGTYVADSGIDAWGDTFNATNLEFLTFAATAPIRASRKLGILPFPGFIKCALVATWAVRTMDWGEMLGGDPSELVADLNARSVQSIVGGDPGVNGFYQSLSPGSVQSIVGGDPSSDGVALVHSRCELVANLSPGSVRSIVGGDPTADGVALVQVYRLQRSSLAIHFSPPLALSTPHERYNGQTNVHIRLRAHALSSSLIAQTVNKAHAGINGPPVWVVLGQWTRSNSNNAYNLQKWYYEANKKYPPGSARSVHSIVREIAGGPGRYYAVVSSVTRPVGAIRGQFRLALPFSLYPWNPC
ncbi:unnamed protein product [Closterium sp. NIES-65]|nr:unnamed protein product [Closterium sp. NIES-65]